jgi:RNA polymerase subunit RPABC4/transcription elongation factor Spt4
MFVLLDWPGGSWEATLRYTLITIGIYLAALWLTLVFWTYRDIRQRSRDPIVQVAAILLVLIFFLPGLWIYLIVRPRYTLVELYERSLEEEALLQELESQKACPSCRRRVQDDFLLCPSCRTQLKEACRSCGKPLNYAWHACPYCGLEKPPRELPPARTAAAFRGPRPQPVPPGGRPVLRDNGQGTRTGTAPAPSARTAPPRAAPAQPFPARSPESPQQRSVPRPVPPFEPDEPTMIDTSRG